MLASEAPAALVFPLYASAKLDGVRAVVKDAMLVSRTLKRIPNGYVQDCLGHDGLEGLDGELTVGPANHPNVMQATTSGVMSREGEPDFIYWVFDYWNDPVRELGFAERYRRLEGAFSSPYMEQFLRVKLLPHKLVNNVEELAEFEQ